MPFFLFRVGTMRQRICHIIITVIACLAACPAPAQPPPIAPKAKSESTVITAPDSAALKPSEKTIIFYDSLESKSNRRGFTRFLYRSIILPVGVDTVRNGKVVDEIGILNRFNGKTISEIILIRDDVFPSKSNWLRANVNGMHARTQEGTITRDLLFRQGDSFDASVAVASNQIIQNRSYIAESRLAVAPDPADTTMVIVTVHTRDNWTIGLDGEIRRDRKEMAAYLFDENFLGTGNRYGIKTNFKSNTWVYGGNVFDFINPNFLGTFYRAGFTAGRNFGDTFLDVSLGKSFILPTDYETGAAYSDNKLSRYEVFDPSEKRYVKIQARKFDIWGGVSQYIRPLRSSFYSTWRYGKAYFPTRPDDTDAVTNPAFHNYDELLVGVGLYRERFYLSSMIYGYGFQEYIASGQRFELTGGYSWQEFGNYWYAGLSASKGGFLTGFGYLRGDLTLGSYFGGGKLWRSAINIQTRWFSNLYPVHRSYLRQFLTFSYTNGWNQGAGAGALIIFNEDTRPVTFNRYAAGSSRLLMNTETVVFTPLKPIGFRIALFGFVDAGFIGLDDDPFRNDFFGTFGIGIRLKNDRLVFNAIQLRFGFALGKQGFIKNQFFNLSIEQRISRDRFIPERVQTVDYK